MTPTPCVMLLIDADNVSADVIGQAVERTMQEFGCIHVRRAYCNVETAMKHQALFKRHSIRPMVNISAGKNSTDIALAVDAMDTVEAERPDVVVLVSSDSDFAPLVIRLREKGCRVCGIGQQGKTGEDTQGVYDSFIDLQHHAARRSDEPERRPARKSRSAAPEPVAADRPAAKRSTRSTRNPRRSADEPAASTPPAPPAPQAAQLPEEALQILDAVPELLAGTRLELNQTAEKLRAARLLGKSASSPKLFKKFADLFALTPESKPSKVQYIGPRLG